MLVDTGVVMYAGSLKYNLWVMSQCPEIMKIYLQYDKDTSYDVVNLLAALDLIDMNQDAEHGKMTTVIRYKIPYIVKGR